MHWLAPQAMLWLASVSKGWYCCHTTKIQRWYFIASWIYEMTMLLLSWCSIQHPKKCCDLYLVLRLITCHDNWRNNTELRHPKGPKKDQTLSEIIDMLRRSKKNQTDVSRLGGKHLYILLPGPSLAVRPFDERSCHDFCTKKKVFWNIELLYHSERLTMTSCCLWFIYWSLHMHQLYCKEASCISSCW